MTALDYVALAAQVIGVSKRERRTKAYQLLGELGLKERYDAKPFTLSGGEQQRVAIARALVNEPTLLLADEPTGNIDEETAGEIMGLLVQIRARGATILIATHDRQIIRRYGSRLILLDHGVRHKFIDGLFHGGGVQLLTKPDTIRNDISPRVEQNLAH